ncbi:MAG: hypothetical protein ACK5NG_06490 [Chthoniobacterales bacterium]
MGRPNGKEKPRDRSPVFLRSQIIGTSAVVIIYDMSKSLGHGLEITSTRLLSKTGEKQDYTYSEKP